METLQHRLAQKPDDPTAQLRVGVLLEKQGNLRSAALSLSSQIAIILIFVGVAGAAFVLAGKTRTIAARHPEIASSGKKGSLFFPTPSQWATMTIEPVRQRVFRSEHVTEGKIAIDEDRSTPIFSPYAGQVVKLFVQPGDTVSVGQPLFAVQATDMVQAQNDFISAATALNDTWKLHRFLTSGSIPKYRWDLLTIGNPPPARFGHTAIYDQGDALHPPRMIVFGGTNGTTTFNDTAL
jgi:biotin carboxyl carrier protein